MDIGKALGYVFEDERWVAKLGIAGGLLLLSFVGAFTIVIPIAVAVLLLGYTVAIVRNVRDGLPRPLPEWADPGEMFADGLKVSVAQFVWALPILLLYAPLIGMLLLAGVIGDGEMPGPAALLMMCGYCLVGAYGIVLAALTPAIYVAYADQGSIADALDVGRVLRTARRHLGDIVVILIVQFIVSLLAGLGLLLCFVGIVFTAAWATFVQGHLYGQLAARAAGGGLPPMQPEAWPPAPIVPREAPMGYGDDIVSEVRERSEEALRSLDDTTVYVDEGPAWERGDVAGGPEEGGDPDVGDDGGADEVPDRWPPERDPSTGPS